MAPDPDQSRAEYEQVSKEITLSSERLAKLAADIAAVKKDHASITAALIQSAMTEQKLGQDIEDIGAKLEGLKGQQQKIRASLSARRDVLAEVLGALQRMGLNPPPAILVKPEDALSSVRSAILLGAVVPELRQQTDALLADLKEQTRVTASIEAVTRVCSLRSASSASVCWRSSGTTAPSRMALRTDDSASSGLTRMAGGGLSPMRCRAPSTSASTSRRADSEARIFCCWPFSPSSLAPMSSMSWPSFCSVIADWISAAVIEAWSFLTAAISAASLASRSDDSVISLETCSYSARLWSGSGAMSSVFSARAAWSDRSTAAAAMPQRALQEPPVDEPVVDL